MGTLDGEVVAELVLVVEVLGLTLLETTLELDLMLEELGLAASSFACFLSSSSAFSSSGGGRTGILRFFFFGADGEAASWGRGVVFSGILVSFSMVAARS